MTKLEKQKLDELHRIGSQMSNVCYNLSQGTTLTREDRVRMSELVRNWDASLNHVSSLVAPKGKREEGDG